MLAITNMMAANAQNTDTFIKIEEGNMFSQCFITCDTNNDGIVTYAEAAAATILGLDKGGRMNIIENYDFLKYFPNLVALSVGNTTLEEIDLHYQVKLEKLGLQNALWIKKIILAQNCQPEIFYPQDVVRVDMEYYVEDDTIRKLLDEYSYCEKIEQDGEVLYIVSKEYGNYGIWHNGKLEVPCKYGLEDLKNNYFTIEVKELPSEIVFEDEGFKEFCLRDKRLNVDKDNMITEEEAKAATRLSLMSYKSFIRNIKSYEDLKYFPNLEYFHAGLNYVETIDLSCCPKLKEIDLSDSRMLKTIILAKGCKPEIKYPVAYKGEPAKVIYK